MTPDPPNVMVDLADRHGHAPPPEGEDQPLRPGRRPHRRRRGRRPQAGGGAGFVNVNNRLFAPLAGLDPANILEGGYDWLDYTDSGMTRHPGLDLNSGPSCNSDEGLPCVSPLAGVVRAAIAWDGYTSGEGSHVWIELTGDPCCPGPTFFHNDHLQVITCEVGQSLVPGQQYGLAGRSGNWQCAHGHVEWVKGAPQYGYWQWPYGWSVGQVEAAYHDPYAWWQAATALVYAEGGQPVPPEVVEAMSDWELTNYVLAQLYEWANIPFNPEGGMAKTWVAALRANVYAGRPRTDDRLYGEGDGTGWWAEFDHRVLIYNRDGSMSWTG